MPKDRRDHLVETWPLQQITPRTTMDRGMIAQSIDEAEINGFSVTQEQAILHQTGVAAPIKGPNVQAFAAIQCSVLSRVWSIERIEQEIVPYIVEAADGIAPQIRG